MEAFKCKYVKFLYIGLKKKSIFIGGKKKEKNGLQKTKSSRVQANFSSFPWGKTLVNVKKHPSRTFNLFFTLQDIDFLLSIYEKKIPVGL